MSKTKEEFNLKRINYFIDKIVEREGLRENSQLLHDLSWIKFHAKELATKCNGCKEAPHGSETDKDS